MKIFVVLRIISDLDGEFTTIDSVFSSEKLAELRAEEISKANSDPDLFLNIKEYIVDDLITGGN